MMQSPPLGASEMTAAKLGRAEMIDSGRIRKYSFGSPPISSGAYRITGVELPPDSKVVDTQYDHWNRVMSVKLYSGDFPRSRDGLRVMKYGSVGVEAIPGREDESFRIEV